MYIAVRVQSVYGSDLVYPVDDTASTFTRLTGRKTFTRADLLAVKALGYEVRVAGGTLPWTL